MKKVRKPAKPIDLGGMAQAAPTEEVFYARVSTSDQSVDMQVDLARKRGIPEGNIFVDYASGRRMDRKNLTRALRLMREGWTLVVWKLDRLGRNLHGMIELAAEFQREGWNLASMTEQFDTRTPIGRLYFHFMAALAQFESEMTSVRTSTGMARVKARGVKLGRRGKLKPEQLRRMEKMIRTRNDMTLDQIAKHFGIRRSNLLYFFPGWRGKSAEDRRAFLKTRAYWK